MPRSDGASVGPMENGQFVSGAATRNGEYAIEVEGLTKSFDGKEVVHNLSLRVRRGQIYGFLGPNGSGKTTTLRMICGLLTPDGGRGTCLGYDILTEREKIKRRVGYMTQRFSLYQDLSIKENLEFVARVYDLADPAEAARQAIERLGLQGRETQLAGTLSGGWKQRLALGACILPKPDLLLLDEPTAGVDPKARREFWGEIHKLAAGGMTVLVSTHYMDEAERCHEIAYIAYGELLAQGYNSRCGRGLGLAHLHRQRPRHRSACPKARWHARRRYGRSIRNQFARCRPRCSGSRRDRRKVPLRLGARLGSGFALA